MKKLFGIAALCICCSVQAQVTFSVSTDVSVLRNLSPQQKFTAFGQTVQAAFHFTPKDNLYSWLGYYTKGKFSNDFTATANAALTIPQQINYTADGTLSYRHLSIGLKHYFVGASNADDGWNIYGLAGFGFLFAKSTNTFSVPFSDSLYKSPVQEGSGGFKRLTFDLGAGVEKPLGGNVFAYADARAWLPASSDSIPYLHNQHNVPLSFMFCVGIRILFDFRE